MFEYVKAYISFLYLFVFIFVFAFFSFLSASSRYPNGRGFEGTSLPGLCYKGINCKTDIQSGHSFHLICITQSFPSQELAISAPFL